MTRFLRHVSTIIDSPPEKVVVLPRMATRVATLTETIPNLPGWAVLLGVAQQRHAALQTRSHGLGEPGVEDRPQHRRQRYVQSEHQTGDQLCSLLLTPGMRPQKRRIKHATMTQPVSAAKSRKGQTILGDVFDDSFHA